MKFEIKRKNCSLTTRFIAPLLAVLLLLQAVPRAEAEIAVSSYLLRDRAIVLDSLLLRKQMIFAFKSSLPMQAVLGCAAVGVLRHDGQVIATDTTWLFDQPAGNLGFGLPYDIPDGLYNLRIAIVGPTGGTLDSLNETFDRRNLKLFFNLVHN